MTSPQIGALFAGYGGLDLATTDVFGGSLAWYSEVDKGALKILGHRFPDVPNVGDVTAVDWSLVEPVDILTGGSPCQDLSHAGRRAGMTEGTRSNLWVAMREAIAQLRPSLVVWENVRGAFSAAADSAVEPCAGCVGDGSGVHLRALGRVLGDLSDLGYDARWHGVRAADIGAPHGRFRVFVVATTGDAALRGWDAARPTERGREPQGAARGSDFDALRVLPTPSARDWKDHTIRREPHRPNDTDTLARALTDVPAALLPTPRASDGEKGGPNQRGSSGDLMLPAAVQPGRLLPTPNARDWKGSQASSPGQWEQMKGDWEKPGGPSGLGNLPTAVVTQDWGDYAAAIARWEHTLGRPAPAPTQTSTKGNPQLSPAFVEWMMGLPAGWVTDTPGITRNEALKALGNGVVPQQAAAAIRTMLAWVEVAA